MSQPNYLNSINDQSVVEICVNRCTSCIRETNTAEKHCAGLVQLLEICYQFNHKPRRREDPPHAKLSSDLISCIFLNYNKKNVMDMALPIAVKFLDKDNEEMSKNLAAYLSLAAIEYTSLLVPYADIILRSLLNGNYSLSRVVLQLYEYSNGRSIILRAKNLLNILPKCEASDKNILLQLIGNIINNMISDDLTDVIDRLPQLFDLLLDSTLAHQVLMVLMKIAEKRPLAFHEYTDLLVLTGQKFPNTICLIGQILAAVGKKNKEKASIALDFILENLAFVDHRSSQTILLQEAVKLCSFYPVLFNDKLTAAIRQHTNQKTNSQTQLSGNNNVTIVNLNSTMVPLRTSTSQNQVVPIKAQVSTTYINNQSLGNKISPFNAPHYSRKQKLDSRSTGRLNNNNNNNSSLISTNRSMTRLSSSQHIHQSQSVVSNILTSNNNGNNTSTQPSLAPPPLSQHVSYLEYTSFQ